MCSAPSCWAPAVDSPGQVPLCGAHVEAVRSALAPSRPVPVAQVASLVYFVTWDACETVKIGITTSPKSRFAALRRPGGPPVQLLVAHPGGRLEEQATHHRFTSLYTGQKELFFYRGGLPGYIADLRSEWPHWKQMVADLQAKRDAGPRRPVGSLGRFPTVAEEDQLRGA